MDEKNIVHELLIKRWKGKNKTKTNSEYLSSLKGIVIETKVIKHLNK